MKVKFMRCRNNRIKKYILCLSVLVLCLACSMTAAAEENAPIRLNNFTGQAVVGGNISENSNEVKVLSNCIYDKTTHRYMITVDEEKDLHIISTVADGMFTNYTVSIETNIIEGLSLFRNDALMEDADLANLNRFGHYILQYQGRKVMEFRILDEYTTLKAFYTPKGFQMVNVTVEGLPAEFDYDGIQMNAEGLYEVTYICNATNMIYSFTTTVDRTAPVLELSELDEVGRSAGPVDISDREPDSRITLMIDGEEAVPSDVLKEKGDYVLTISDRAGNYNTYQFTIGMYLNGGSIAFAMIWVAVILAVIVYVIVSGKRLKVY